MTVRLRIHTDGAVAIMRTGGPVHDQPWVLLHPDDGYAFWVSSERVHGDGWSDAVLVAAADLPDTIKLGAIVRNALGVPEGVSLDEHLAQVLLSVELPCPTCVADILTEGSPVGEDESEAS